MYRDSKLLVAGLRVELEERPERADAQRVKDEVSPWVLCEDGQVVAVPPELREEEACKIGNEQGGRRDESRDS